MILSLLIYLKKINIMSLIVEGCKETINHFLKLNYWNEARVIIGNKEFKNGLKSPEINKKYSVVQNIGKDIITLITMIELLITIFTFSSMVLLFNT